MVVVFYISGHGFGHATRSIELINELGRRRPGTSVIVRTAVPQWFFDAGATVPIHVQAVDVDTGVAQVDSLRLDEAETARRAAAFYADFDSRVAHEMRALRELNAEAVVADIPPLGIEAAGRAGLPALALGNFTWDWIYEDYPDFERLAPGVIRTIAEAYARSTRALRLPMHGGFASVAARVCDIPFIARRSRLGRAAARKALGLSASGRVVLASFGGHGLKLPYDRLAQRPFTLVATDYETQGPTNGASPRCFTRAELTALGCRYEDLVAAADVVVSKPGYGIVSECIANGVALLYTDRGRFREHDVLVAALPAVLRARFITQEDLLAGRWESSIDELLRQAAPAITPPTDGVRLAVEELMACADRRHA